MIFRSEEAVFGGRNRKILILHQFPLGAAALGGSDSRRPINPPKGLMPYFIGYLIIGILVIGYLIIGILIIEIIIIGILT